MDQSSKQEVFAKMPVGKALWTMALPTVISQLINLFYNMVDTFFIGRTGNSYMVAAITISFTVFMLTVSISNLFGIGGGSQLSRKMGTGRMEDAKSVCAFSVYGAMAAALLYSLIVAVFLNPILSFLGASQATAGYAKDYIFWVVIIGNLPGILSVTLAHLLRSAGLSKQASIGLSGGGILNMLLDPLFMFVLFPSGMEVTGAAVATLLSNCISALYLLFQMKKASVSLPVSLNPKRIRSLNRQDVGELFAVGVPSAILTLMVDVTNAFMNILMSAHGDLQLAAMGIVMKAERLPTAVNLGITQGMLPIVAYNYASREHERMRQVLSLARKAGLAISLVCLVLFELFADPIVSLFLSAKGTSSQQAGQVAITIGYAAVFLRLRIPAAPFKLLNFHSSYCLQAMGDGKSTFIHSIFRDLVFQVPMMYLLDALWGENGLAAACAVGEAMGAAVALLLLNRKLKKLMPD